MMKTEKEQWLNRQLDLARKEVETWSEWRQRELKIWERATTIAQPKKTY